MRRPRLAPEIQLLRKQRDSALAYARDYAKGGRLVMVQAWIDRAQAAYPLTEIQLWGIKNLMGAEAFRQLDLSKIHDAEAWQT